MSLRNQSDRRVKPVTKKFQVSLSSASLPTTVPTGFARSQPKAIFKVFSRTVRIAGLGGVFLISDYTPPILQKNS